MSECGLCSHGLPMSGGGKYKPSTKKSAPETKTINIQPKAHSKPKPKTTLQKKK